MNINRSLASLVVGVIALAGTGALAVEGLTHKPGLWETKVQVAGHTMVTQMCTDAATEASNLATTAAYMKEHCTKNELSQQGDKFISDTECTFAGHHVIGHGITTRIGDNAFHTEGTTIVDAKWLGPCKAGQKPGLMMRQR
jgi:hypothetical protein